MLEHAFGYDLRTVRLHDDAMSCSVARGIGATAFATGTQIVMDGSVSRHVLAHEVAHVIQSALQPAAPAIHCYESPEHEDLGDKRLDQLQVAAEAEAHLTGNLAMCAGSCGPGNTHLINELFDCHRNRVPALEIALNTIFGLLTFLHILPTPRQTQWMG
jgi:hypothetical protein